MLVACTEGTQGVCQPGISGTRGKTGEKNGRTETCARNGPWDRELDLGYVAPLHRVHLPPTSPFPSAVGQFSRSRNPNESSRYGTGVAPAVVGGHRANLRKEAPWQKTKLPAEDKKLLLERKRSAAFITAAKIQTAEVGRGRAVASVGSATQD